MHKSQELAKLIVKRYSILTEGAECAISSMIENHVLSEINKFVNNKNLENYNKQNEKQILPRKEINGVQRVQVWNRR